MNNDIENKIDKSQKLEDKIDKLQASIDSLVGIYISVITEKNPDLTTAQGLLAAYKLAQKNALEKIQQNQD
jgi:hypothetical protein